MKMTLEHNGQTHDFIVSDGLLKKDPDAAVMFLVEQLKLKASQLIEWPEGMSVQEYADVLHKRYAKEMTQC